MAQNGRRQEDLELGLIYLNNDSLARKADVMQYPGEGQARQVRKGVEAQRRKDAVKVRNENVTRREGEHTDRRDGGTGRRNPYLADYNLRNTSTRGSAPQKRINKDIDLIWGEEIEHPIRRSTRPSHATVEPGRETRQPRVPVESGRPARTSRTSRPAGAEHTSKTSGRAAAMPDVARPVRRPEQVTAREQRKRIQQEKRRKEVRQRKLIMGIVEVVILVTVIILVAMLVRNPKEDGQDIPVANPVETQQSPEPPMEDMVQGLSWEVFDKHPEWTTDYLTPNEYSRPGDPLGKVKNIFVHYTANKNTSAKQNRSYFEQLKDTHERGASAHFIIGYEGEIIQCVPLDEIAYAVATRNEDSISIECCFISDDGSFTQETYDSLIALLSWLTDAYGLESEDILRHYDCGGKKCPIYYTENEDAWERLKADVRDYTL